jgi:hypothetical protein
MSEWPRFKAEQRLKNILRNPQLVLKWNKQFQSVYEGKIDTWDFQWDFALLSQGGLSIQPKCNLVTNIGFGPEATHTTKWSRHAESKVESMPFPLNHPTFTVPDDLADELTQRKEASLIYKAVGRLKGLRSK